VNQPLNGSLSPCEQAADRFREFQKNLGLAKNILSARLHGLVKHGIMQTVPAGDGSPYQEYVLTEKGRGLFPVLVAPRQWSEEYFFEADETRARLVDREHRQPVAKLEIRAADGRLLDQDDTEIVMTDGPG
jgi:DNA-binding HxlR family transcriptional regulator